MADDENFLGSTQMARLLIQGTDIFYPLSDQPLVIGRSSQCDITIHDDRSSRKHCKICKNERGYNIQDMGSYNGTYVNGKKIHDHLLEAEDQIKIGKTVFIYSLDREQQPAVENLPILLIQKKRQIQQVLPLAPGTYSLGRSERNDICLDGDQISSMHATVFWKDKKWWLQDLHSKNGTYLNQKSVNLATLRIGDVICIGNVRCSIMPPGFKPKPKRWLYYITAAISVAILLLLAFFHCGGKSPYGISRNPDNLLDDFSFEYGSGWELRGAMQISQGVAKSGRSALSLSQGKNGEAHYQESVSVVHNCAYRISAWTKFNELQGVAGVKITWLNKDHVLGDSFSPLLSGKSEKWQKIEFVVFPPPDAKKWRLSCFVLGSAASFYIDDIEVVAQKAGHVPHLSQEELQVFLDSGGTGKIYYRSQLLIEIGCRTGFIATGKVSEESDSLLWEGCLYRLEDFSAAYNTTMCFTQLENTIELALTVTLASPSQKNDPYSLSLPFMSGKKARIGNGAFNQLSGGATTLRYLVWDNIERHPGIIFKEPLRCSLSSDKWGFHLQFHEDCKFSIENLAEKDRQVSEIEKQIEKCQKGQPGKVMRLYNEIATNFTYHPLAPKAREKLWLLRKDFQEKRDSLLHLLERAHFFHNSEAYAKVIQKCRDLQQKWQGIEESQELISIADRAEKERLPMVRQQREKISRRLLQRAQNLEQEKQTVLAWMFYREILENYPESENMQEARERCELIERQLVKLRNFFSKKGR